MIIEKYQVEYQVRGQKFCEIVYAASAEQAANVFRYVNKEKDIERIWPPVKADKTVADSCVACPYASRE